MMRPDKTVPVLFQQALEQHRRGDIAAARAIYQEILGIDPQHADALHCMGVACYQTGQLIVAVNLISEAIRLRPDYAEAYSNRGVVLKALKRYEEALKSCDEAIRLRPEYAEAYLNRGNVLLEQQRYEEALASYDAAIRLRPDYVEAYLNQSNALLEQQRYEEALKSCDEAVRLRSDCAEAYLNRGNALQDLRRYEESIASYDAAIRLQPDYAEAYLNRGNALQDLRRYEESIASYDEAARLKVGYAEVYFNRGNALKELERYEDAVKSYDEALRRRPENAMTYLNRGNVLLEQLRFDEALESYDASIRLWPDYAEAYLNRGNALLEFKRYEEALRNFEDAIRLRPQFAVAYLNKSFLKLLHGEFGEAWKDFEWRWQSAPLSESRRAFVQPPYTGAEPLEGKTILLHAEQGLGDTIQFCRYARRLRAAGATVILEVQPALVSLIRTIGDGVAVIATGDPLPPFDIHAPLLSLPLAFDTTLETIPSAERYLAADIEKVGRWQQRLGSRRKPRVGLSWNGNADHRKDRLRSIGFRELLGYLPDNAEYYALQNELRESDREAFMAQERVTWLGEELRDFSDTAALAECMDLLVSVDTSVAHLGGALGKRSWVLLPYVPDWRWLLDREDSPWYPSVRLYRQGVDRGWGEVLERVRTDLEADISA